MYSIRYDWTQEEINALLLSPLFPLLDRARAIHKHYHDDDVQLANLLSIKTGGCTEDCAYCSQSVCHKTFVKATPLLSVEEVADKARDAQAQGATRFCMGAAWREARDGRAFERILAMIRAVRRLGMEACATLGMLTQAQAHALADAGLTAYNHNLDTAPSFYGEIITTRTYEDRLRTLDHVRQAGMHVCCGGIIGMGETWQQRAELLAVLSGFSPHPESVPINALVAVAGTPLAAMPPVASFDMVRMCAVARITMPKARVRLSAGRKALSLEAQTLCFMAGANSIFFGDKLLTTDNQAYDDDKRLLETLGLHPSQSRATSEAIPHHSAI
ncbi:MAG: biotin synthase BioB [Alphaproteobacteria bacterium GM7ARS4]|nr:biotin synthase BioB [Alphaproteobacteria bacterium GM7ARS4]